MSDTQDKTCQINVHNVLGWNPDPNALLGVIMKPIEVHCSPLSKRIFAGRTDGRSASWSGQKFDVTRDAINAVVQHIGVGHKLELRHPNLPPVDVMVVTPSAHKVDLRKSFETWAKAHGGLPLDEADPILMRTDDGLALATFRNGRTEIAWRAWANKPSDKEI